MIPLAFEKVVSIPPNKIEQILQPKYTTNSFQTQLNFQGRTMVFVDPVDKYIDIGSNIMQY